MTRRIRDKLANAGPLQSKANPQKDPEIIGAILALRAVGWSSVRIGSLFKLAPSTVLKRIRQHENAPLDAHKPTV